MNREDLFELLDMDTPEDFGYFEQFAELLETEETVEFDDFYSAISAVSAQELSEINKNYFDDISKEFPDGCDDFLEVFESIKTNLENLVTETDDASYRREYAENLYKFKEMYTKQDGAKVDGRACTVMEALATAREGKMENVAHSFDFEGSLDYEPDYISMRLGGYEEDEYGN